MRFAKLRNFIATAALSFTIFSWLPQATAQAQVQTLRYDLPGTPLFVFNLGVLLDFGFPIQPAEIVKTPLKVFCPVSVSVPVPVLEIAAEPATTDSSETLLAPVSIVGVPVSETCPPVTR